MRWLLHFHLVFYVVTWNYSQRVFQVVYNLFKEQPWLQKKHSVGPSLSIHFMWQELIILQRDECDGKSQISGT